MNAGQCDQCGARTTGLNRCDEHRQPRNTNQRWRQATTKIILVIGPPAAGKTTFVDTHAQPGDLIVDYDALATAMGCPPYQRAHRLHPIVNATRNTILNAVRNGTTGAKRVWIISANPNAETVFPHHKVILINPGSDITLQQAQDAERPDTYPAAIRNWYLQRAARVNPT